MGTRHQRINGLLDAAIDRAAVVLVCAPRGYGKTAALTRWVGDRDAVSWPSPDRLDVDALVSWNADPGLRQRDSAVPVVVVDDADEMDPVRGRELLSWALRGPGTPRVVLCGHQGLPGKYFRELAGTEFALISAVDLELHQGEGRSDQQAVVDTSWPAAASGSGAADGVVSNLLAALGPEAGRTLLRAAMLTRFDSATMSRVVGQSAVPHIAEWITAGAPLTPSAGGAHTIFRWADGFGAAAFRHAAAVDPDAAVNALRAGVEEVSTRTPSSAARLALTCGQPDLASAVVLRGWPELVFDGDRATVLAVLDALPHRQRERPDVRAVREVVELWGEGGEPTTTIAAPVSSDRIRDPDLAAFHRLAVATDVAEVAAAEPTALDRVAAADASRWAALQHLLAVIVAWWRPGHSNNVVRFEGLTQAGEPDRSPAVEARISLDRATELAFTGSFTAAVELLGSVGGPDEDGRVRVMLAMVAYWRGNSDEAKRLVAEVVAHRDTGRFWRATAQILAAYTARDSGGNPAVLRRAIAAVPADLGLAEIDVHRQILDAYLHLREGRQRPALEILARVAEGQTSPALQVMVAVAYARAGAHARAQQLLDHALGTELPTQVLITGMLCQAVCHARIGRNTEARNTVNQALVWAEPDGIWGPFLIGEHEAGALLVRTAHVGIGAEELLRRILVERALRRSGASLTEREREIYGYLATNRTIAEIAGKVGISASTAKEHTRSLYRRLGVSDRIDAVARMG